MRALTIELVPVRREAHPEEIVHAVQYLLENPHVTGTVQYIDGGERFV